jgi:hypothetical protein
VPVEVDGRAVAQVRESWLVEDRWWTGQPLRRRYWEVVTGCGRNVVVFRDLAPIPVEPAHPDASDAPHRDRPLERASAGGWFVQR